MSDCPGSRRGFLGIFLVLGDCPAQDHPASHFLIEDGNFDRKENYKGSYSAKKIGLTCSVAVARHNHTGIKQQNSCLSGPRNLAIGAGATKHLPQEERSSLVVVVFSYGQL